MREKINCFKHCSVSAVTVNWKIESPEDNPKYLICLLCCCSEGIPSRHLWAGAKESGDQAASRWWRSPDTFRQCCLLPPADKCVCQTCNRCLILMTLYNCVSTDFLYEKGPVSAQVGAFSKYCTTHTERCQTSLACLLHSGRQFILLQALQAQVQKVKII